MIGTLQSRALAGFMLAILLVALIGLAAWQSALSIPQNLVRDQQLRTVRAEHQGLLGALDEAVLAQRGYVITGDSALLAEADSAMARTVEARARLQREWLNRPDLAAAGPRLDSLVSARLELTRRVIRIRSSQGYPAARDSIASGEGFQLDREITAEVVRGEEVIGEYLAAEVARTNRAARRTAGLTVGGSVFAILLLAIAAWTTRRSQQSSLADVARLKESEARIEEIVTTMGEVFWSTDVAKTRMHYVSPGYDLVWGRSHHELYDAPQIWKEAIHPDDRPRVLTAATTRQADGRYDETYRILRPNGDIRWIHERAFPVRGATGAVERIVGVARDVTDQQALASQLQQSQKLEAIGRLAGGVAHDFNNLLTVILSYTDLMDANLPDTLRPDCAEIRHAAERAKALTQQLLAFSRRQTLAPTVRDMNEAVRASERLLVRLLGEQITLRVQTAPEPVMVLADQVQLDQVLLNLAVNARDAMPDGGVLGVCTAFEDLTSPALHEGVQIPPGRYGVLSVSDTGVGMDRETLARLFEPFFTTKPAGVGTGLGLATVHGIVKQSGGEIWVYSEPRRGTTFRIYLPCAEAIVPAATVDPQDNPHPSPPRRGRGEHILLVEDDPALRTVTHQILAAHGYQVTVVSNAEEALALADTTIASLALLLTDVVLPGLTGPALAQHLRARHPGIRVLYVSGYVPETARTVDGLDPSLLAQKPFTVDGLRRRVQEALDHPGDLQPR